METKGLGEVGITVSAIDLGVISVSIHNPPSQSQVIYLIHCIVESVITLIDTVNSHFIFLKLNSLHQKIPIHQPFASAGLQQVSQCNAV